MNLRFPSPCINNLQGEGKMNMHYKKRYDKFIELIKFKQNRVLDCYTERHHIIPRCIGGSDEPDNLVRLTLREHFLAHWLLWKAYPNSWKLASAFLQMNNKNPQLEHIKGKQGRITSRVYENLKTNLYKRLSEHNKNNVYVKDDTGKCIKLTRQEYASQNNYKFHTTGKVYVLDTKTDKSVYITSEEYQKNKSRYVSRLHGSSPNSILFNFVDIDHDCIIKMTKTQARLENQKLGYKKYKQQVNSKTSCVNENGEKVSVLVDEYKQDNSLVHMFSKRLPVFDLTDNTTKSITLDEYNRDKKRYRTSTKGKVLARDKDNNTVLIDKSEFETGEYVGITKGLRTVKNSVTGQFEQITEEEYLNNKSQYVGPNQGKVNVIDKITGERKQILKQDFDKNRYSGLGNKLYLFKCRNKLTGKEKNVNIYEWHLVKDQYDIIDMDKYKRALKEK